MNADASQIDRIVREVVRQLMSPDAAVVGALTATATATSPTSCSPPSHSNSPRTLAIADRVITMQSLSGRLVGITRVQVRPNAVVTPLVVDWLREQGVCLERHAPPAANVLTAQPLVCLVADDTQAARVTPWLDQAAVAWQRCPSLDDLITQLADKSATRPQRAIVITSAWATVACQANRHPAVRAAAVHNLPMLREACQQLDVNVLVLDPTQTSNDLILEFVKVVGTLRVPSK
jgi:hypothetical protein